MITRFAPAPTGWLHLGHVLNAEFVWRAAREHGASVLLRIEDHDRERCRPEYESGILDDLDWLGYTPDIFPTRAYRAGYCRGRQSDREDVYRDALDRLVGLGLVYACECTRKEIAAAAATGELRYAGRCRNRALPLRDGYGWRVRLQPTPERFVDEWLGPQTQVPAEQCGDMLIRDRHGNWTYQFAVAVDDFTQDVGLVVRGMDLLASTGRQMQLARLLGRTIPARYLHHPLIMKSEGVKLSKSDGATGIRHMRARGMSAAEVRALARASVA